MFYLRRHLITGALTIKVQCDILTEKSISSQKTSNTLRDDGNIEHPELLTMIFIFLPRFFPNSM